MRSSWKLPAPARPHGPIGAAAAGAAFGVGWTPCIGAQLAAILAIAGSRGHAGEGALLLMVYGLGLGVPFIAAGIWLPVVIGATRTLRDHWGAGHQDLGRGADRGRRAAGQRPPDRPDRAPGRLSRCHSRRGIAVTAMLLAKAPRFRTPRSRPATHPAATCNAPRSGL